MPTHENLIRTVVNQMMKGPNAGRLPVTKRMVNAFTRRHEDKIRFVLDLLPQHKRASAAVPAVVTKALIVYGLEKTLRFCRALTDLQFTGTDDPAHLLWLFLLRNNAHDELTVTIYQKTICCVKAYMEGRIIPRLTASKQDIFTWDEDYTLPDDLVARNEEVEVAILNYRLANKKTKPVITGDENADAETTC